MQFFPAAKLSGLREQITLRCRRRRRPSSVRVLHHLSHQFRLSIINCGYLDIMDILGLPGKIDFLGKLTSWKMSIPGK